MPTGTADRLLDRAQTLVQQRGYNAFSFKDLAQSEGIRTASVHYHFPTKAALGEALMSRYLEVLREELTAAAALPSATASLRAFVALFVGTERAGLACVCGSLAADVDTLPAEVHRLVRQYLAESQAFVERQIERGVHSGELAPLAPAADLASTLIYGLHGALMVGRAAPGSASDAGPRLATRRIAHTFFRVLGLDTGDST